ncbi:hypothetical protein HH195_11910 (plasmid) [Sarcina sp. JB2]|jgi:hypothetical protein|uniref:Uncharacterized protein n=1 Tax=Candidatus Sarcina troglodytae TaxID=2726954 RepID=A0ACD1BHX7_9CLOT|nr:hypothetical protein [Sarcina sp. JB2]QPJ86672.1 hypothetical protein HH195_11910 [Sarcina sp. JB2]
MYKSKRPKKITVEYEDKAEKYIKSGVVISLEPVLVKGIKKIRTDIAIMKMDKKLLEYAAERLQEIIKEIK